MKHCKGCSHPTTCNTMGCAVKEKQDDAIRKFGEALEAGKKKALQSQRRNEANICRKGNDLIG